MVQGNIKQGARVNYRLGSKWLSSKLFLTKFRNTFLNIPCLWGMIIRDHHFDDVLHPSKDENLYIKKIRVVFLKIVRFWPRVFEAGNWAKGDIGTHGCDPLDFKLINPHSQFLVDAVMQRSVTKNDKILDLGCNCGRFLAALAEDSFDNLYGVDISQKALSYMNEWFPILEGKVNVSHDLFQRYLSNRKDKEFDIVYTHGATVELVHPSYPLIQQICRVTSQYVVFVINENWNRYPRFWEYEFMRNGFLPVEIMRPISQYLNDPSYENGHTLSLMVFKRVKD